MTTRRTSRAAALGAVVFLAAAGGASARSLATIVGQLNDLSGDAVGVVFDAETGTVQNLFISDSDDKWVIRAATGTEIRQGSAKWCGFIPGVQFGPVSYQQYTCDHALRVELGDLDDRLVSVSSNTKYVGTFASVPGLVVNAGTGRDTVTSGPLPDTLRGGSGNDTLTGMNGDDKLFGDGGDDTLMGLNGADEIDGGAGVDTANYPSPEPLTITLNDDVANDGRVDEEDRLRGIENVGGGQAGDSITGSAAANRLNGHKGADRIFGLDGGDTLIGWLGNDRLQGGNGDDRLEGGDGSDTQDGGAGADTLLGGAGDDVLTGGAGIDRLEGGDGTDRIYARDGSPDLITCGAGVDIVEATAADQIDESTCETILLA